MASRSVEPRTTEAAKTSTQFSTTGRSTGRSKGIWETLEFVDDRALEHEHDDWRDNDLVMRKRLEQDRVAFLLFRSPPTSFPSSRLCDLEASQPIEMTRKLPMTQSFFNGESKDQDQDQRDTRYRRRRDRVTEYTEARLLQANVLRSKMP
jgi:hypothetical protein